MLCDSVVAETSKCACTNLDGIAYCVPRLNSIYHFWCGMILIEISLLVIYKTYNSWKHYSKDNLASVQRTKPKSPLSFCRGVVPSLGWSLWFWRTHAFRYYIIRQVSTRESVWLVTSRELKMSRQTTHIIKSHIMFTCNQ